MGPIGEGGSLLLRINRNCPWNRCLFCPVYKDRSFSQRPAEEIRLDIDAASRTWSVLDETSWSMGFGGRISGEVVRRVIRENPGQITLLPIGPLTNVALLFKTDPEIPSLLKGLVMMCGAFENNRLEWNAMLDPHASEIVYRARPPIHRSIGTDVTMQVTMTAAEVRQRFQGPLLKPVLDFAEIWFKHSEILTFHDPLAATTLFHDGICGFTRGRVSIDLGDWESLGKTHWVRDQDGPQEAALSVNPGLFFDHFFSYFEHEI